MTTQEAVQLWGGHVRLAKVLGITRDAIYKWGQYPPMATQFQIMEKREKLIRQMERLLQQEKNNPKSYLNFISKLKEIRKELTKKSK